MFKKFKIISKISFDHITHLYYSILCLAIRVGLGLFFVFHALTLGENIEHTLVYFLKHAKLFVVPYDKLAYLIIFSEIFFGFFTLIGLFTRFCSVILILTISIRYSVGLTNHFVPFVFFGLILIFIKGAGYFSTDEAIRHFLKS